MKGENIKNEEREIHGLLLVLIPLINSGNHPLALQYIEEKRIPYFRLGLTLALIQANASADASQKTRFMGLLLELSAVNTTEYRVFNPSHN